MYIGQTCRKDINVRFGKDGKQYVKCKVFWNAIKKYKWDGFEHILLIDHLTREEADICEIELIKKYKTTDRNYGYNLSPGG